MRKKCPDCGSKDVTEYTPGLFGESRHRCNSCGKISCTADFVEPTLFDHITQSQEVLAPLLVREYWMADGPHIVKMWVSKIVPDHKYKTEAEAIAATLERLEEVYNGN